MATVDAPDDVDEFDAMEYVPDRIDAVTANGINQMYESLGPLNRARVHSEEIEVTAHIFWQLVEKGAIESP